MIRLGSLVLLSYILSVALCPKEFDLRMLFEKKMINYSLTRQNWFGTMTARKGDIKLLSFKSSVRLTAAGNVGQKSSAHMAHSVTAIWTLISFKWRQLKAKLAQYLCYNPDSGSSAFWTGFRLKGYLFCISAFSSKIIRHIMYNCT